MMMLTGSMQTTTVRWLKTRSINGKKYLFDVNGELLAGLRWLTYDKGELNLSVTYPDSEESLHRDLTKDSRTEDDLDYFTTVDTECSTDDDEKTGLYYFAKPIDDDASMKTGSCTITIDGDTYSFKFKSEGSNKGKGINGPDGNYYYVNGRKLVSPHP